MTHVAECHEVMHGRNNLSAGFAERQIWRSHSMREQGVKEPEMTSAKSALVEGGFMQRSGLALAQWSEKWFPDALVFLGAMAPLYEFLHLQKSKLKRLRMLADDLSRIGQFLCRLELTLGIDDC